MRFSDMPLVDSKETVLELNGCSCYSMKMDLLTNATVVDDAIRFVSHQSKEKPKSSSSSSNQDEKESSEPDYDDDKDQLEEEQEEEAGEVTLTTTNEVF